MSAVDKLTKAEIKDAAAKAQLTDEQKKYFIAAMLGKSGNDQLSFSFATLKANALAAGKAMLATFTNPITLISTAITLVSIGVSAL